eukprot:SAG11_NODE_25408_length_359_cov_0.776923_1_plen_49_part_10
MLLASALLFRVSSFPAPQKIAPPCDEAAFSRSVTLLRVITAATLPYDYS